RNGVDERRPHPLAALALTGGGGEQWRVGWARANGVEGDAAPRHFAGHGFGEGDDAALAGRIDRLLRSADPAGGGRDVDDTALAARHHALQREVAHVERPAQVDRNELVP